MTTTHPEGSAARDVALELAVQDPDGVRVAAAVRAHRVPPRARPGPPRCPPPRAGRGAAAGAAAAEAAGPGPRVEVHVLVRPRPGGFVLTPTDLDVQVRDVRRAVAAGAAGVVVGGVAPGGREVGGAVRTLVDAADGREVTFHRAVDVVADPLAALDALSGAGVVRVLTSGGASRSIDGTDRLRAMAAHARDALGGRVQVMAGGGVRPQDVGALVAAGVDAVHLSAKRVVADDAGPGGGGDAGYEVTDPEVARAARAALDAAR